MYIGTKRSPEKIIGLWIMTFGAYGIYWLSKTFAELKTSRKKGISGKSYMVLAFLFPPLALSACWLLPAYVGKLYAENGKLEHISSCWGAILFLPTVAIWSIVGMSYLIISAGGMSETGVYIMGLISLIGLSINIFLLYNWLKKIQIQINDFWDDAEMQKAEA